MVKPLKLIWTDKERVDEQAVRQPPTNENCLIKKGMLRVISGHKKAVELSAAFLYSIDFQLIADL